MKEWTNFDTMLTPKFITLLYWVLVIISVLRGLTVMFAGAAVGFGMASAGGGFFGVLMGLLTIVVGVIGSRVFCELLIILFKIYENTKTIAASKG